MGSLQWVRATEPDILVSYPYSIAKGQSFIKGNGIVDKGAWKVIH